jgi:copper chaperone CopZ
MGDKTTTLRLAVTGMTCSHCEMRVNKALSAVAGVKKVKVELKKNEATVITDGNTIVSAEALLAAVRDAGYEASVGG